MRGELLHYHFSEREGRREGGKAPTYQDLPDGQVMPLLQDELFLQLALGGLRVPLFLPLPFARLWTEESEKESERKGRKEAGGGGGGGGGGGSHQKE